MAVRDDEGLIFQDTCKNLFNEDDSCGAAEINENAAPLVKEVTNNIHVNAPVFSGVKFGIGLVLGGFVGMTIISVVVGVIGYVLFSVAGGLSIENNISMLSLLSNYSV